MKKIRGMFWVVAGALLTVYGTAAVAQAIDEIETSSYSDAQPLVRAADGTMSVKGVIGVSEYYLPPVQDVDLYSFFARKDDLLAIDIDNGIKKTDCNVFGPPRCVDTTLTILGPDKDAYPVLRQATACAAGVDMGSMSNKDACILNFLVPADGIYIVAVTADPVVVTDGVNVDTSVMPTSNGEYLLIVTGASEMPAEAPPAPPAPPAPAAPLVQPISIAIKPGSYDWAPFNPKSKGNLPVALLSSDGFDALKVDRDSLTFGATGDEDSFRKCNWGGQYVNKDDKLDLVCHFDSQASGFGPENTEGILKGTIGGNPFEGHGVLRVLPVPKKQK